MVGHPLGSRARHVDPIPDLEGRPDGESPEGFSCDYHPEVFLVLHPDLRDVVLEWRSPVGREWTRAELERASLFEVEAWQTMRAADARQQARDARDRAREASE